MGVTSSAGGGKRDVGAESFSSLDTNHDGFLYFDDIPQNRQKDPKVLKIVFHLVNLLSTIDLDGDGKISEEEYAQYKRNSQSDEGKLRLVFGSWDLNQDGTVSTAELVEAMEATNANHAKALGQALKTIKEVASDGQNSFTLDDFLAVYTSI